MALREGDKFYSGLVLRFQDTINHWAAQSAQQLRDSYRMQRMWNGTKSNEVYGPRKESVTRIKYRVQKRGNKEIRIANGYKVIKIKKLGWFDLSQKRREDGNPKSWYSTGEAYRLSQDNPVVVEDATLSRASVRFNTTLGAIYAEAGVGLSGHKYIRGSKPVSFTYFYQKAYDQVVRVRASRVKVNRAKPWTHSARYISRWISKAGETHRPNIRMQVNLLSRRLAWAARTVYGYNMAAWLAYELEGTLSQLSAVSWQMDPNGKVFGAVYDEKTGETLKRGSFRDFLNKNSNQ